MLFALFVNIASGESITTIEAQPDQIEVTKDQEFEINLFVTLGEEINGIALNLSTWDSEIAKCIDVEQGNIFSEPLVWIPGKVIDNEKGIIEDIVISQKESVKNSGFLATIKFKAEKNGLFKFNIPPGEFDAAEVGVRMPTQVLSFSEEIVEETFEPTKNDDKVTYPLNEFAIFLIFGVFAVIFIILLAGYRKKNISKSQEKGDMLEETKVEEIKEPLKRTNKKNNVVKVIRK